MKTAKCSHCNGAGKMILIPDPVTLMDWEQEFEFRKLEAKKDLPDYCRIETCVSCQMPFQIHEFFTGKENQTCSVECHSAWLKRGRTPLNEWLEAREATERELVEVIPKEPSKPLVNMPPRWAIITNAGMGTFLGMSIYLHGLYGFFFPPHSSDWQCLVIGFGLTVLFPVLGIKVFQRRRQLVKEFQKTPPYKKVYRKYKNPAPPDVGGFDEIPIQFELREIHF